MTVAGFRAVKVPKKTGTSLQDGGNSATIKAGKRFGINLQLFAEQDLEKQSSASIRKGITNLKQKYELHVDKVAHPEMYDPDFATYTKEHQEGLVHHWEKEMNQFQKSIERRRNVLKERGEEYDD